VQHRPGAVELEHHLLRVQAQALAGALHHRAAGRRFAAHEERDADQAFEADHRDLGRGAVLHQVQQRDDRGRRKVHVVQPRTRFVEHFAQWQIDHLEVGQPALEFDIRHGRKQLVLTGREGVDHEESSETGDRAGGRSLNEARGDPRQDGWGCGFLC
jgi:hypothetical protein